MQAGQDWSTRPPDARPMAKTAILSAAREGRRDVTNTFKLAVIGGDGIGPEVTGEALKVLRAATPDVTWETTDYDLGARRYHKSGETLPDSVLEEIRAHDVILLGAIGDPSVPSGVLERGLLLRLRL